MRRSLGTVAAVVALGATAGGCGYTMVKKSDLHVDRRAEQRGDEHEPRIAADSATIVSLQTRLTVLSAQCRADSVRYAALAMRPATTAQDSIIRVRDEELVTLRDQLAKAQAELDRIKRRIANPRP